MAIYVWTCLPPIRLKFNVIPWPEVAQSWLQSTSMEATANVSQHGAGTCKEEGLATLLAQDVTQKIKMFAELHLTLEGFNNGTESNTKRIAEAESRISDAKDFTTSLSNKIVAL